MAFPHGRYSPLGGESNHNVIYNSPVPIQGQWANYNGDLGMPPDLESPPIEMHGRPNPAYRQSGNSFQSFSQPPLPPRPGPHPAQHGNENYGSSDSQSTLFPTPNQGRWSTQSHESQSFLNEPINKLDTSYSSTEYHSHKDNTGRQLLWLLLGSSVRWSITVALCAAHILSIRLWVKRGAIDENHKKIFNAITTGISLALGLNIASSFKDLALNMRWPILSARRRNLNELDLILNADSLGKLFKLVFITKRPIVVISCLLWLFINIAAQAGIAMLNLTYGFDVNYDQILLSAGRISVPDMSHFYPNGDNSNPSIYDEEYTANLYGGLAFYGLNKTKYMPKAGEMYKSSKAMLWYDDTGMQLRFSDQSVGAKSNEQVSVYSNRTIKITHACEAHRVLANGDGRKSKILVEGVGNITVNLMRPNATNYFTNANNTCESGNYRCSVVEAFEASDTNPWYYKCNITMGQTQNDPANLSYISDQMAFIATSAIAQNSYTNNKGQQTQVYPRNTIWGTPNEGDEDGMGSYITMYALGSIAGASLFNPSANYSDAHTKAPVQAYALNLNHPKFFYLIIGMICGCQLLFVLIVAILSNRVKVGPDTYLSMALLLRPIADALEGVGGEKAKTAYARAKRDTTVKYEKNGTNGRWYLKMLAK